MNQKEFLTALAKTKETRKWQVTKAGTIRAGCACPIAVVAGSRRKTLCSATLVLADRIGLNIELAEHIMNAADLESWQDVLITSEVRLRRRMLRVLGLMERRRS